METDNLKGRVALVTGAGRGIGKAIVLALLKAGVDVMATARSEESLRKLIGDMGKSDGNCEIFNADLADATVPSRLVEETIKRYNRLDILINNAGILPAKSIAETTTEEWDRVMAVNARAPFLLCQAVCPHMKNSDGGTIIQIASVVGEKSYVNQGAYTASKHALMGFSKVLAQEVKEDNVRVHTILPGGVDTDMTAQLSPDFTPSELMAPTDIADIIMFLLTHRNNAVIDAIRVRRSVKDPWF